MTDVKIYRSRWKSIKSLFVGSVLICGAVLLVTEFEGSRSGTYLSILLFALTYPVAVYRMFDTRPSIIINEIGIFDRKTNKNFINWEIIQHAYISQVYKRKFISLVIDKTFEPSTFRGKFSQNLAVLLKAIGLQELNISLGKLPVDGERLTEFIIAMKNADKPKRISLISQNLPTSLFTDLEPWELRDKLRDKGVERDKRAELQ